MRARGNVAAEARARDLQIGGDDFVVFAMRGDKAGGGGENRAQALFVVDHHIAGRRAHKHFESGDRARIEGAD